MEEIKEVYIVSSGSVRKCEISKITEKMVVVIDRWDNMCHHLRKSEVVEGKVAPYRAFHTTEQGAVDTWNNHCQFEISKLQKQIEYIKSTMIGGTEHEN